MDLATIAGLTAAVLGVLLVVLVIIAVVVLGPAVRRSLAERSESIRDQPTDEPEDDGAGRP